MPEKKKGILQEHINEQLDNRRKPLKREKQDFSMIAVLGGVCLLYTSHPAVVCTDIGHAPIFGCNTWERSKEATEGQGDKHDA